MINRLLLLENIYEFDKQSAIQQHTLHIWGILYTITGKLILLSGVYFVLHHTFPILNSKGLSFFFSSFEAEMLLIQLLPLESL